MEGGMIKPPPKKRKVMMMTTNNDGKDIRRVRRKIRRFKVLLPNGTIVELKVPIPDENEMRFGEFLHLVRIRYLKIWKHSESMKKKSEINWNSDDLFLEDANDNVIKDVVDFRNFVPNKCHILRLKVNGISDSEVPDRFENMWDLTPDTDLLMELPENYNFEAAITDLIDNALQAVWFNGKGNRKLIGVNVSNEKITIFDSGSGMDDSDENSIVKWGKMGASLHRQSKSQAIGGKPPYLMDKHFKLEEHTGINHILPCFGMFGYGGPIASMHLGRSTRVSSKTKHVKNVYELWLHREALLNNKSNSEGTWKTTGGIRAPHNSEVKNSKGSFTKVDIYNPKVKDVDIKKLLCHLKDIYFPYIQNDDLSDKGRTITPIQFQINGVNLTEIQGGEVATTNLHSCNDPEFVLQIQMSYDQDHGSRESKEANARLRFVYFPFTKGKESIERVLETLKDDGHIIKENFQNFSRVSVRRLGRLLPDARWAFLPFMDLRNKRVTSNTASILKRCSLRVKCYVETDAGFKPTQSKTDLAHQNPFTIALKNLGCKISDKKTDVSVKISTATKILTPSQIEQEYHEWILEMHRQYDDEADAGEDKPVIVVNPPNKEALGISEDVIRVHRILKRKEKSWSHGQKIKVLRGACSGFHYSDVYATIEYFLLEGFEGDLGGEARIICRPIDIPEENGCSLDVSNEENPTLNIGSSLSLPISVIDTEKLVVVDNIKWKDQLKKIQQKLPASIDLPGTNQYKRKLVDVVDSISRSVDKRMTVKRIHCALKYKLLTNDQCQELDVRVGSTFPSIAIACYDIHDNRTSFPNIPDDVTVELRAAKDLYIKVHGVKAGLSIDKMTLKIMDAMVTSSELDKIRPSYRTTLIIASENVPLSISFPCRVSPGYLEHVKLKSTLREDQLLPGFIFKELVFEMFDAYRNHVSEGLEVNILVTGFKRLDHGRTLYKVDDKGKIDLGGQLKLTAGYGENASISVIFEGEPKFKKEFSIARRILRIASEVPKFCATGGQLENVEFEIVNADGDVDAKIHNDDQECQFHMLTIKSGLSNADESIRYTFEHGRCKVPSIRVPEFEGTFCFEASHSQYTELCLTAKVQVIKMSNVKDVAQHLSPDKNTFPLKELSTLTHDNNLMISVLNSDGEKSDDICQLGQKINEYEDYLKKFNDQEDETQKELLMLQDNVQHYQLGNANLLFATTKEEMTTKIKNMENSAASVLCSLSAREKQHNHFLEDIIGVVALLVSVQSPELSRMLAEYLGEDQMLGVICRSLDTAISLEKYKQNGEIDYVHALHAAEAASLGKAISKRFHVMGFEDIRPYDGNLQNDSQRKLALPDPKLSNRRTPEGFMGYAVNMIDLDSHHLQTRTASGHGLRETVLFSLFKKLHVYKTCESMIAAIECIENGAVSLDGGIIRENGTLSLGLGNPCIYFPCGNKIGIPPEATEMLNQIEEKKALLLKIEKGRKKVTKHLKKSQEKFKKKELRYKKHIDTTMKPLAEAFEQNPEIGTPMLDLGD